MDRFNTENLFDSFSESEVEQILECLSIPDEIFEPISDSEWADLPTIENHLSEESTNDQIGRGDADMEPPTKRTRYQCETCEKNFSRSDNLKRHQKIHDQYEKPFECKRCAKKFKLKQHLKRHEKVHEKRTVEREYKCGTCGEDFRNAGPYRAHIKSAHPQKRKIFRNDQGPPPKKSKEGKSGLGECENVYIFRR